MRGADAGMEGQAEMAALPDVASYCLTMEYAPSSTMHGFTSHELVPGGAEVEVTLDNVEEYVKLMCRFVLDEGVAAQREAIREGIAQVFPPTQLNALTPQELRRLLAGEGGVSWTREELVREVEPRNGYTAESETFIQLVDVLCAMEERERRDFLRFATGVRVLPPGGLKNLDPKLTVVKKICEDDPDQHFPSANTCFHFVKLPQYSCKERLAAQLRAALTHGMDGFFFN